MIIKIPNELNREIFIEINENEDFLDLDYKKDPEKIENIEDFLDLSYKKDSEEIEDIENPEILGDMDYMPDEIKESTIDTFNELLDNFVDVVDIILNLNILGRIYIFLQFIFEDPINWLLDFITSNSATISNDIEMVEIVHREPNHERMD
jgi:hypothetical protein